MRFVYLVPVGAVEETTMAVAASAIEAAFGLPTRRMDPLPVPEYAYDGVRMQYSSSLILKELAQRAPADTVKVLAVTNEDLFIPMLKFVFGQAQLDGLTCIVSTARLKQEYYGMPPDEELLNVRVWKEVLHELGHSFGLVHCPDPQCAMVLSTGLEQLDVKDATLCKSCSILLHERVEHIRTGMFSGRTT